MTLRRRRMLATLLALALCLSLLPMSALAAEADALGETGPEEAVCTCTAPCTEGGMNTACPVCGAEGAAPEGQRRRAAANPCPRAAEKRRSSPWQMAELACCQLNRIFPT